MSSISGTVSDQQRMISAIIGASVTALVVTPLDVVKTRLQSQAALPSAHVAKSVQVWCGMIDCVCYPFPSDLSQAKKQLHLAGTWDGIAKIARHEGFFQLWRGLSATLLMAVPTTVIYFIGYEHLRNYLKTQAKARQNEVLDVYTPFLAGSLSRALAVSLITPAELFRTKIQAETASRGLASKVIKDIFLMTKTEGIHSLWRGLSPMLWRDVPFSGIYWMGYESFRPHAATMFEQVSSNDTREFLVSFLSGATSGALAALLTTPFDVAKTWSQVGVVQLGNSRRSHEVLMTIYRQEGVSGLFRGVVPRVLKTAPACAIMISSYELGKKYFDSQNARAHTIRTAS